MTTLLMCWFRFPDYYYFAIHLNQFCAYAFDLGKLIGCFEGSVLFPVSDDGGGLVRPDPLQCLHEGRGIGAIDIDRIRRHGQATEK